MPICFLVLDEPYIPEEQIAAGPSGIVYRGHDLAHDCTVRLKVLLVNHLSCPVDHVTMQTYVPHLQELLHPNVAALLALDVNGDEVTMISEFAEGVNGWAFVQSQPLSARDAQALTQQLLLALEVGARRSLPHGNVKPSNLMIVRHSGEDCELKLLDWGLSQCRSHQPHETLALRAPECLRGGAATAQSDLFSAAATIAALLLGRLPVMGLNEAALHAAWLRFDPDELRQQRPDVDAAWMNVLLLLLNLDPARRPASAKHAVELFSEAVKVAALPVYVSATDRPVPHPRASADHEPSMVDASGLPSKRRGCISSMIWLCLVVFSLLSGSAAWMIKHRDNNWPPSLLQALDQIEAAWLKTVEKAKAARKDLR